MLQLKPYRFDESYVTCTRFVFSQRTICQTNHSVRLSCQLDSLQIKVAFIITPGKTHLQTNRDNGVPDLAAVNWLLKIPG